MDISKVIRSVRDEKRLTQLEVAERLQMERSNYARLEARDKKLSIEQLEAIAGALGVGLLELLTGEPPAVADGGRVKELEEQARQLAARIRDLEKIEKSSIEYQYELAESLITAYVSFAQSYGRNSLADFLTLAEHEKIGICVEFLSTITPFLSLFSTAEWKHFEHDKDYKSVKTQLSLCRYLVVYYQERYDDDMPAVRGEIKLRAAEIEIDRKKKANGEQ